MGKSVKVLFDNIIFYLQSSGGGSVYWFELTKGIAASDIFKFRFLEYKQKEANFLTGKRTINSNVEYLYSSLKPIVASLIPTLINCKEKFIFHSSYYRYSVNKNAVNVITIHDFIPEKYFSGLSKYIAIYRKKMALKFASGVICVSKNTYNDLLHFYPNIIDKQVKVIYNGVSDDYHILENRNVGKDILFIGKRDQYKNFAFSVEVVSQLKDYRFVIIGNELTKEELDFIGKYKINYKLLSKVDNNKLNEIYNEAFCLLYPSSYEGFGIPVIEAMKAGCPVVALNASSISEIANNSALLADELSLEEFTGLIKSLENNEIRDKIIEDGIQNSSLFSWKNTANETAAFYLKLMYESD